MLLLARLLALAFDTVSGVWSEVGQVIAHGQFLGVCIRQILSIGVLGTNVVLALGNGNGRLLVMNFILLICFIVVQRDLVIGFGAISNDRV